jgi:hypothetical protein
MADRVMSRVVSPEISDVCRHLLARSASNR